MLNCHLSGFTIEYLSVFVPVPYCLDDHSFVVQPEIWHCDPPALVFFFNIPLAIWDPF